jgi:hypothetical protein
MNDALAFGSRVDPCADQALRLARELLVSDLLPLRSVSPCLLLLVLWAERSPQKKQTQTRRHSQPRRHRGWSQTNEDQERAGRPNALSCAWVGAPDDGELVRKRSCHVPWRASEPMWNVAEPGHG